MRKMMVLNVRGSDACRGAMLLAALVCGLHVSKATAAPPVADPAAPAIVLDTRGFWRMHVTLRPPLVDTAGGLKPVLMIQPWLNAETPEPAADWTKPQFDDSAWTRDPVPKACRSSYVSRLCARGKFLVADPAQVGPLTLSLDYQGGAIVYLNGQEVRRQDLAPSADPRAALATPYPKETFVNETGGLLVTPGYYLPGGRAGAPSKESERRMTLRRRSMTDVRLPAEALRKGVNVLAVEIVRAPYDRVLDEIKIVNSRPSEYAPRCPYDLTWNTCELLTVRLTAPSAAGLTPNATRPAGVQVWNSDALNADYDMDFGDPSEPLGPIRLVGPRRGSYSGKVVLGSTATIAALRGSPGDLSADGGAAIPASCVRVRYGLPWGDQAGFGGIYGSYPYPRNAVQLEAISDVAPAEILVPVKEPATAQLALRPAPVLGAVVPIWVTVDVPAEARPGLYRGTVRLTLQGHEPIDVPVEMTVVDWTLPERQNWRTWIDMIQSTDTLALEYSAPLWSEKHWELIAASFKLMREAANQTVYVPLIAHTNLGNEQSMVRLIDRGDDNYDLDFSVMDRYLDLALKHMGKPKAVILNVWDVYLIPKEDAIPDDQARAAGKRKRHVRMAANLDAHKGFYGVGPMVTVVDPKTGKTENAFLDVYGESPESTAHWKRLFTELRAHMEKRGLGQSLMLGMMTDAWPSKQDVQFFLEVAPGIPWMIQSHDGHGDPAQLLHGLVPVAYQAQVWGVRFADATPYKYTPAKGRMYGWKNPGLLALFERFGATDAFPAAKWRHTAEYTITGDRRGIGRLGADFWEVLRDNRNRRVGRVPARYPEAHWRNLNIVTSLLAPGPAGPSSTNRYEQFREGLQECEARILIEDALTDQARLKKLGPDLAKRCQDLLDDRLLWMWKGLSTLQLNGREFGYATGWRWTPGVEGHRWYAGSGWQKRSEMLFALAGEVDRQLKQP